jgi:hypothetical protein
VNVSAVYELANTVHQAQIGMSHKQPPVHMASHYSRRPTLAISKAAQLMAINFV